MRRGNGERGGGGGRRKQESSFRNNNGCTKPKLVGVGLRAEGSEQQASSVKQLSHKTGLHNHLFDAIL